MSTPYTSDSRVPVKRLQFDVASRKLEVVPEKKLFLRGPIPLNWLAAAAHLPGKTLNVAVALRWLNGMAAGKPISLTRKALEALNIERDAARMGLNRLADAGLIRIDRKPGRRPVVSIMEDARRRS